MFIASHLKSPGAPAERNVLLSHSSSRALNRYDSLQQTDFMPRRQVQKNLSITRFELTKRVLVLVGLAGFLLLGLIVTRSSPKTGWSAVVLFGVMTILAAVDLIKLRDHKIISGEGARSNVRASLIWFGTMVLSIFYGLLAAVLSNLAIFKMPVVGLWLTTFVSTLAFYPFRGEQAKELDSFPLWAIYSALMGVVSVGISQLDRWLD